MQTQLKMRVGVAFFATLAMIGMLIFTFSASQTVRADGHSASRSFSPVSVAPGGEVTVTVTFANYEGPVGSVTETLPAGFAYKPLSSSINDDAFVRITGQEARFTILGTPSSLTYVVTASSADGTHDFSGTFTDGSQTTVDVGGVAMVTVGTDPTDGTDEVNKATDSTEPGSNQSLRVRGMVGYATSDDITVNLASFGVPSSINVDHVTVSIGDDMDANPTDVEIDGTKVTLVAPFDPDDGNADRLSSDGSDPTTITFRRSAGITLPTVHGDYDIKVSTEETQEGTAEEEEGVGGDGVKNTVEVRRQVKVSPTSGKRGTEITITAKGYSDNTHDIVMGSGDNSQTKTADATDGVFTLTVDTSVKNNDGNSVFQGPHDTETTITVPDGDPDVEDASATFTIKASFSWEPESPTPGQDITVTLSDIEPEEGESVEITIGGEDVLDVGDAGDEKNTTWKGQVNGDTRLGNRKIAVSVGDTDLPSQNITVGTNDLTVSPTTVVPRQTMSIDGDGFTARGTVDLSKVTVDGEQVRTESGETEAINNNGNVSFDITVPETVSSGPATVKVVGSGDRIGTASITIAEAKITVSPAESLRGSTITVSGTGFPANDLVLIKYNTATVDTASTSPTGTFEQDITVPASEDINPGGKYTVKAVSQINEDAVSDDEEHKVSDPTIVISPDSAAAGSAITITGSNFKGFLRVASIEIGGQDVTPVPAPSTDQWGAFTASDIQVPQLNVTRHAVKVVVGRADGSDGDATEFVTVVAESAMPALTDPADVFADLIEAGTLSRVWHLNAALQTSDPGNAWSFYDPNPDLADFNKLTEIQRDQSYVLIMTAEGEFNDKPLYSGTNFVFIP